MPTNSVSVNKYVLHPLTRLDAHSDTGVHNAFTTNIPLERTFVDSGAGTEFD